MSNQKYNSDEFIQFLINYFKEIPPEKKKKSFRKLYQEEILHSGEKKGIRLPCFSQARNILLSELKRYALIGDNVELTTEIAMQIQEAEDDLFCVIREAGISYKIKAYSDDPIICTLNAPDTESLQSFADGYANENEKTELWGRHNLINKLCKQIKLQNPDIILAVIPETNRLLYLTDEVVINRQMKSINPLYGSLCMFIKNTPEGQEIKNEIQEGAHMLSELIEK